MLAACGGGGGGGSLGGGSGGSGGGGGGGGTTVTVSGKITYDKVPFKSSTNGGLDPANAVESPARGVVVEAVVGSATSASTTTDANGDYSLTVAANTSMFIRVRARLEKTGSAPTWTFTVRNNTNSDAIYAMQGDTFNSGSTNLTRNLRATSGWTGSSYGNTRVAAPFAIIDTVYQAKELIRSAAPNAQFPELNLYWSTQNRTLGCLPSDTSCPTNGLAFCPDQGNIGTSFYVRGETDQCTTPAALPDGIYILGEFASGNGDTDEFDSHVIAHEFGHYFEDQFSRSDSIGGNHGIGDRLDLRVAFGEGWGNAFGGMALNDPQYRDSSGGVSQDFGFNMESNSTVNEGWFSETSVGEILWDIFDSAADSGDNVSLGFTPIYNVMTDAQIETEALTSIFSFASALRSQNSGSAAAIATLLSREGIDSTPDAFGSGQTVTNGGDTRALPVYGTLTLNVQQAGVCSSSVGGSKDSVDEGIPNKLGNHRFFVFDNNVSRLVTIRVQGAVSGGGTVQATDPDFYLLRQGEVVLSGSSTAASVEQVGPSQLAAGRYVLDVFDYDTVGTNQSPRCMTVSITGT